MVQDAIVLGIVHRHVDHLHAAFIEAGLHQWHEFARAFKAWGYGGQYIFVVPHLNAVIVATGGNYVDSEKLSPALSDYIFRSRSRPEAVLGFS